MSLNSQVLTAQWVVPVSSAPIPNGAVLVERGAITDVGPRGDVLAKAPADAIVRDYGSALITPGLINLHTHLDYTLMRHADTDSDMFGWIRGLVTGARQFQEEDWLQSALQGASEVALSGTTCVADCSYRGAAAEAAALVGLRAVVGLELFGIDESRVQQSWDDWLLKFTRLEETLGAAPNITLTVSPHAPYTVAPALWRRARDWARERALPVLCHLSESQSELDFITGNGVEVLEYLSWVYQQDLHSMSELTQWSRFNGSPVQYLQHHDLFGPHMVAAHAVHLQGDDFSLLRQAGAAIAHCPRSNARLRNGFAPLTRFLAEKIAFGFGTDSAASTADLSVLQEARFSLHALRLIEPSSNVSSEDFFRHLTLGAAQALGIDQNVGSLQSGKWADLAVFAVDSTISGRALARPYEMLMHGGVRVVDVFVNGTEIVASGMLCTPTALRSPSEAGIKTGS